MFKDVELRKLPAGTLYDVINTLETNDDWKKVLTNIPKNPLSKHFEQKYNEEHIRLIEEHAKSTKRPCAEIMFDEWATSGRIRPTLSTLKKIVEKVKIYKAADQIADILKENRPVRPNDGPEADIDTNVTLLLNNEIMEERLNALDPVKKVQNDYSHDQILCNVSTVPLETQNGLGVSSRNIPDISCLQSLYNKPTIPVMSSNLIKFSEKSMNIPDLSAMFPKSHNFSHETTTFTTIDTQSEVESTQHSVKELKENSESLYNINYQQSLPNISDLHSGIDKVILQDTNLINFEYNELETITNKFCETIVNGPFGPIGKIGSGGFGKVFVGYHPKYKIHLAVKKIHSHLLMEHKPHVAINMFNAEVKNLSQFRHKNVVPILGFSMSGPVPCIVCEYIDGGSLEQQLVAKVLNEKQRIDIMLGTAEGLKYLHKSEQAATTSDVMVYSDEQIVTKKNNFVHRDVKSANILLTKDCVPKLCDFGLAKQYESTFVTTQPMGTSAYMAPEGFSGTITQKIDIYSYGIVLLELLTGLKPIVENSNCEKMNIKDYIKEHGDINSLLDPVVGQWTRAEEIYVLSQSCLRHQRTRRPSIDEICEKLYIINSC